MKFLTRSGLIVVSGGVFIALTVGALVAVVPRSRGPAVVRSVAETTPKRVIRVVSRPSPARKAIAPAARSASLETTASLPNRAAPFASPPTSEPSSAIVQQATFESPGTPAPLAAPARERSDLGDGIFAERSAEGGDVIVHFDTEELRTRFEEKFEHTIRRTLPAVFGPEAKVALDSVPVGALVRGGSLLYELPQRGIALRTSEGRTLMLYPVTRPGHDGPLVVGYRATLPH